MKRRMMLTENYVYNILSNGMGQPHLCGLHIEIGIFGGKGEKQAFKKARGRRIGQYRVHSKGISALRLFLRFFFRINLRTRSGGSHQEDEVRARLFRTRGRCGHGSFPSTLPQEHLCHRYRHLRGDARKGPSETTP